ncbi:autotransporter domain-containing protein, partial [Gammaproteobacteria bacterium]|nr:autotransporter domain-containing protein [Gammaproteobacteria bacterium]
SADGSVIVGYANDSNYNGKAFRWTLETGMESVEDWLSNAGVSIAAWSTLDNASSTNSDGSVVVGSGVNANGDTEAFIARVSGVVGLTDLSNSLASQVSPSQTLDTLTSMALNGAHHRPLTDIAMSDGEHCVWASTDLGRIHRNGKGWTSLKEVGGCHDFVDNTVRVGVGVGHSRASINQSLGGSSRLHGKYALVEIDWTIPNSALVASVLGMTGRWEADIRRGYSAGTSTSTGDTDMESSSLRARVDWRDAFSLGAVSFSPSVQYTHTSTRIDGYQETGGTAPARFDSQHNKAKESRVALQGAYEYSAKTTLLGRTEWAHRFDSKGASVSGSANILNAVNMPFNVKGNDIEQDWVRVGAEVVHRFSRSNRLSLSTTAASVGEDADFSVGVNWTMLF